MRTRFRPSSVYHLHTQELKHGLPCLHLPPIVEIRCTAYFEGVVSTGSVDLLIVLAARQKDQSCTQPAVTDADLDVCKIMCIQSVVPSGMCSFTPLAVKLTGDSYTASSHGCWLVGKWRHIVEEAVFIKSLKLMIAFVPLENK